jgi:hypothetical protein
MRKMWIRAHEILASQPHNPFHNLAGCGNGVVVTGDADKQIGQARLAKVVLQPDIDQVRGLAAAVLDSLYH